ncbi:MAG: hypothetical protein KAR03_10540 [Candidatus Thorarchaeota archaeon]|nr:hypothetical protein [Candidatus Thorarchaeota archaeon]
MSRYGSIGEITAIIGLVMFFIPVYFALFWMRFNRVVFASQGPDVIFLEIIAILGLFMIGIGLFVNRPKREREIFLAKGGGPIHSCTNWKKGNESGVYLTTCEIIVSINPDSKATGNVGYKIVPAKEATCSDCSTRKGKVLLYSVAKRKGDM